jgi:hypothetical protein
VTLPDPEPGLVVRYSYLWRAEALQGLEEGRKDRPCAIVLARTIGAAGKIHVLLAPVTHRKPEDQRGAVEIPAAVKRRLGLDDAPSWIVTDDLNIAQWPGPDLRPIDPRNLQAGFVYGMLPKALADRVLDRVRAHMRAGRVQPVTRTK